MHREGCCCHETPEATEIAPCTHSHTLPCEREKMIEADQTLPPALNAEAAAASATHMHASRRSSPSEKKCERPGLIRSGTCKLSATCCASATGMNGSLSARREG